MAAGLRFANGAVVIGPEFYGSTVVSNSKTIFRKSATPRELILGAHFRLGNSIRIGLGGGPGC